MTEAFTYSVFGLGLRSDIPLPDLIPAKLSKPADVAIVHRAISRDLGTSPGHSVTPEGTLLNVRRVGRYLIRGGREIIVEPDPASSEPNVRLFLLGSALGALLHQRGLLPLHANAIEIDGRAVAFAGHSGAGKSTIAAWFHDQGYRILSDDVCVVGTGEDGLPIAYPGIPRLRLWREALEVSGRTPADYTRSFDDMDKYDVPAFGCAQLNPVPLDRVYLLRKATTGTANLEIRRLRGVEALDAIVSNTYRGAYLKTVGQTGSHLAACLQLTRIVPILQATRPWGYDRFHEQVKLLEDHCRAEPSSTTF